jgi:hypothetical protein
VCVCVCVSQSNAKVTRGRQELCHLRGKAFAVLLLCSALTRSDAFCDTLSTRNEFCQDMLVPPAIGGEAISQLTERDRHRARQPLTLSSI